MAVPKWKMCIGLYRFDSAQATDLENAQTWFQGGHFSDALVWWRPSFSRNLRIEFDSNSDGTTVHEPNSLSSVSSTWFNADMDGHTPHTWMVKHLEQLEGSVQSVNMSLSMCIGCLDLFRFSPCPKAFLASLPHMEPMEHTFSPPNVVGCHNSSVVMTN